MDGTLKNICAVIVTYNCGEAFTANYFAIKSQVQKTIIIDNGSDEETLNALKSLENPDLEIIYFSKNHGLAAAQNAGIKKALEGNFDWILLLDHDSLPEEKMVKKMLAAHEANPKKENTAIIGPRLRYKNGYREHYGIFKNGNSFLRKKIGDELYYNNLLFVISSGSLINLKCHSEPKAKNLGRSFGPSPQDERKNLFLMRDDFFIDFIDVEFGLRANKAGYNVMVAGQAYLQHEIGRQSQYKFGPIKLTTNNYPAWRREQAASNRVFLVRKYIRVFPLFVLYSYVISLYEIFLIAFFEKEKFQKISAIIKGTIKGSLNNAR